MDGLEQAKVDFPDALGSVQGEPEDRLNKSAGGWEAAGGSKREWWNGCNVSRIGPAGQRHRLKKASLWHFCTSADSVSGP
jgi:hypothetical protein